MLANSMTKGVDHIALTVPDLVKARVFFIDSLGFSQIGEAPHHQAAFLTDGTTMITLWQTVNPTTAIALDHKNIIGLHHFALKVANCDVLEALHNRLRRSGDVEIEVAPEFLGGGPDKFMMCVMPGGIRMELITSVD